MEQRGHELHLGRSGGEVVLEDDLTFVETALPGSSFLAGDSKPVKEFKQWDSSGLPPALHYLLPQHEVHGAVLVLHWPSNEPKRVIFPPGLPLFRQTGLGDSGHLEFCLSGGLGLAWWKIIDRNNFWNAGIERFERLFREKYKITKVKNKCGCCFSRWKAVNFEIKIIWL